jgi:hypothetical protein
VDKNAKKLITLIAEKMLTNKLEKKQINNEAQLWHGHRDTTRYGYFNTDNVKNIGQWHRYIYNKIWILFIDLLLKN